MASPARVNSRILTKHLHDIGAEAHTIDDSGRVITKEEALARLLWNKALGWEETTRDEEGNQKTIKHKPESWAAQYIYERKEGKAVTALPDTEGSLKASTRVRDLARQRMNGLAKAAVGVTSGPPKYNPKKND